LPTFNVRPHALAGTAAPPRAVQVRAADLRRDRELGNRTAERVTTRDVVRSSGTTIRPTRTAAQPQPLARGQVGRLGTTPPRAARNATVVQSTAQRQPGTPSAQQRGEQRQTAPPQRGLEAEQRRGGIAPPNAPRVTEQAPIGTRRGTVERRAAERRGPNQPPAATEQRLRERTPVVRAPTAGQGVVQRGPAARPEVNRPPAVAARPQVNRPPPIAARPPAVAARPPVINRPPAASASRPAPPAFAARPPVINRPPPAAVAPRPAPPAFAARPPVINRPPPVAAAPRPAPPVAAAPRPAAPPARPAPPATMGAAPRGFPGQRRQ